MYPDHSSNCVLVIGGTDSAKKTLFPCLMVSNLSKNLCIISDPFFESEYVFNEVSQLFFDPPHTLPADNPTNSENNWNLGFLGASVLYILECSPTAGRPGTARVVGVAGISGTGDDI